MAVEDDVLLHLLHLPATVLVAVLDCLGDAGAVVRTALACKALWHVASNARFNKVNSIQFHCYHPELQHVIPKLVQQFPNVHQLDFNSCSALSESWLKPMATWPIQRLNTTNMWHWDGAHSACLLVWAPRLTHLTANGSGLPLAAAIQRAASGTAAAAAGAGPSVAAVRQTGTADMAVTTDNGSSASMAAASPAASGPQPGCSASAKLAEPAAITREQQQQQVLSAAALAQESQHSSPSANQQQQQQGCNSAQWPTRTCQLQQLHLQRLLVDNPVRCKVHGSSGCSCTDDTLLSQLLMSNQHLTALDLSHNPMLPDRLLHWALTSNSTALQTLNLAGCERLCPGYVATCCPGLVDLDVSGTDAGDADLLLLAAGLSQLSRLNLNGCKKVTDEGIAALASSYAVQAGQLQHLDIGCLTRTTAAAVRALIAALARAVTTTSTAVTFVSTSTSRAGYCGFAGSGCGVSQGCAGSMRQAVVGDSHREQSGYWRVGSSSGRSSRSSPVLLHLGLSRTAGVNDAVLEALVVQAAAAGGAGAGAPAHPSTGTAAAAAAAVPDGGCWGDSQLAEALDDALHLYNGPAAQNPAGTAAAVTTTTTTTAAAAAVAASSQPCFPVPRVALYGLELAGCNSVSCAMLQQLARLGFLSGLVSLDLSDVEALRQPSGSWNVGANVAAAAGWSTTTAAAAATVGQAHSVLPQDVAEGSIGSAAAAAAGCERGEVQSAAKAVAASAGTAGGHSAAEAATAAATPAAAVPQSVLGRMFAYCGRCLTSLALDGCHLDDATAAYLGARCPGLQRISLVGCRGLQSVGLKALLQACDGCLTSLQLGGSHSRWKEGKSLSGLRGLTEFRLLRRNSVRDAELAPILAANSGLKTLALVGCYSCTDQVFVLATDSNSVAGTTRGGSNSDDRGSAGNAGRQQQQLALQHRVHQQQQQSPLQKHLTQLVLTACDGIMGGSISRLRGLRHLRVSYCASFNSHAVQQITLSCTKLVLLELPAQLQRQFAKPGGVRPSALNNPGWYVFPAQARSPSQQCGSATSSSSTAGPAGGALQARQCTGSVRCDSPGSGPGRNLNVGTNGWPAGHGFGGISSHGVVSGGLGLPQQGSGGHLHGLKVVAIGI